MLNKHSVVICSLFKWLEQYPDHLEFLRMSSCD